MRTLHLTTPHMHDGGDKDHPDDVSHTQRLLHGNRWGRFYFGRIDGEYGEASSHAAFDAKMHLGYRKAVARKGSCGDRLRAYLGGEAKLPLHYRARRAFRLRVWAARAARRAVGERIYAAAAGQIGETEHPAGSNVCKFSTWYGMVGPWCAMFVSWCGCQAKSRAFVRGSRWAYVPYLLDDAKAHRNNLAITSNPRRGDLVCYDWDGDGVPDHVGVFEGWVSGQPGMFTAIEGNTSLETDPNGSQSNGGIVCRRSRVRSLVSGFVRVQA